MYVVADVLNSGFTCHLSWGEDETVLATELQTADQRKKGRSKTMPQVTWKAQESLTPSDGNSRGMEKQTTQEGHVSTHV